MRIKNKLLQISLVHEPSPDVNHRNTQTLPLSVSGCFGTVSNKPKIVNGACG